jgi:flagellar basal-body rod modification protein FlgD
VSDVSTQTASAHPGKEREQKMSVSTNISSIGAFNKDQTTRKVSASVSDDGSSVDSTTSALTEGAKDSLFTDQASGLTEDDFLKLLMVQLQNQDPTSPMDNTQLMSQMAQLEAIQSNNNMQKAIKEMNTSFQGSVSAQQSSAQSMTNATSVSLIGKTVRVKESELTYSGAAGETMTIRVNLGNNSKADVQILDGSGNVVKTLSATDKDATNAATVTWDGKNEDGTYAQAGTYTITIVGQDSDASLYAFEEDVVQGVSFSGSGAKLKIAGKEMSVSNVMDVAKEATTSGLGSLSQSSAIELIGKTVRVKQNSITYWAKDGEEHVIKVNAEKNASVTASIVDSEGSTVAVFNGTADANGYAEFSWNGQSTDGKFVDPGIYTVKIDGEENNTSLYCYDEGTVDGVSTSGSASKIRMNGNEISIADIIDISAKS